MNRIAILLLTVGLVGCGGGQPQPAAQPEPRPEPESAPPPSPSPSPDPEPAPAPSPVPTTTGVVFPVEDTFYNNGRGVVASGPIQRGTIKVGDALDLLADPPVRVTVKGIDQAGNELSQASAGHVGLLLGGIEKGQLSRGDVLATPGTLALHSTFTADLTLLTSENGGRKTPVADRYRPQVKLYVADVTATIGLPAGTDTLAPGASARVTITPIAPTPVEPGLSFSVREGGREVGRGTVVSVGR